MPLDAEKKKQARRLILDALNALYPTPMRCDSLFRVILGIDCTYQKELARKDIAYLEDKGYVRVARNKLDMGNSWDSQMITLSAEGKEIADQIMTDPALEI